MDHGDVGATPDIERAILSIPEAAKRLGLSYSGARNLVKRGELPGMVRLGPRIVVRRAILDAWLLGQEPDQPSAS